MNEVNSKDVFIGCASVSVCVWSELINQTVGVLMLIAPTSKNSFQATDFKFDTHVSIDIRYIIALIFFEKVCGVVMRISEILFEVTKMLVNYNSTKK